MFLGPPKPERGYKKRNIRGPSVFPIDLQTVLGDELFPSTVGLSLSLYLTLSPSQRTALATEASKDIEREREKKKKKNWAGSSLLTSPATCGQRREVILDPYQLSFLARIPVTVQQNNGPELGEERAPTKLDL